MSLNGRPTTNKRFITMGTQLFPGGHAESIGKRPTMEDACSIYGTILGPKTQYYGVFDGHGNPQISRYVAEQFPKCIQKIHQKYIKRGRQISMREILPEVFRTINSDALKCYSQGGTTAAVVFIDLNQNLITCANAGDTRIYIVKGREAQCLSVDHKVSNPEEERLVRERGGTIIDGRVNGFLAVTRSIGDAECSNVITCEPYVVEVPFEIGTTLLMACDGVWDVMDDQMAADIVFENKEPLKIANELKDEALLRGTSDNVTVLCVNLTPKSFPKKKN